jgi:hypothetical protein
MKTNSIAQHPHDDGADLLASDLAADMLSFLANLYEQASTDSERLDIILRYGSVMQQLQHTINKAARRQQRRAYPGKYEHKEN